MKKIVLFTASMILCAGLAFAQNPKKPAKANNTKEVTTQQAPTADREAPADAKPTAAHQCGRCPNSNKECHNSNKACQHKDNKMKVVNNDNKDSQKAPAKDEKPAQSARTK